MTALKAEFRKLLTVRSTYVLTGLGLAFVVFYAGYIQGFRLTDGLKDPHLLSSSITGAVTSLPVVFAAIVAILLMTHEYRYNTIMYSLTLSNSRSKVLAAKFLVISLYALLLTAVVAVLSPVCSYLGVQLSGHTLVPQTIEYSTLVWRVFVSGWSYVMAGLVLAVLLRNQIAAIVSLFAVPIFEQILTLILKNNSVYLPFMAQNAILLDPFMGSISHAKAAVVFGIYLLVGWVVAWVLFLKRDAN